MVYIGDLYIKTKRVLKKHKNEIYNQFNEQNETRET